MTPTTHNPPPITVSRDAVRSWLSARRPEPPDALRHQLDHLLATAPDAVFAGESISAVMGALGLHTLNLQPSTLDAALHLLAADAFVTYAFEAASEEGFDVTGLAHQLLTAVRA